MRGRSYLKHRLAIRAMIDVSSLLYRPEILSFLEMKKREGYTLILVSACAQQLAERVASHLGCFDSVYASSAECNLKGNTKARFLQEKFGYRCFDYIGDSRADLKVWRVAHSAYVVGNPRLARRTSRVARVDRTFSVNGLSWRTFVAAIRGHHWFKNLLVFLPVMLAHRLNPTLGLRTLGAFVLFGMSASGIYVLNDLLDLHSDREHPWKKKRPFAAGEISIPGGLFISSALLGIALPCAFLLSPAFFAVLAGYIVLTMWYSLRLKSIVLLDTMILSAFYSIRIWAGAVLTSTPLSHWFLSFSLFFFLSLAMAKRYSELLGAKALVASGRSGRGYLATDGPLLMNLGIASGFSAIVIFSLYVNSADVSVLYTRPEVLLLLAPLLAYWLSRVWLQAHRGELHDDPITLALRDRGSYSVAAAAGLVLALSVLKFK
jgi:4-hydroxybenzoate polyprenyltransferase